MDILENLNLFFKALLNTKTEQAIARIMFKESMTISTVESCTGGLVSSRLTDISGSSVYIKENYITYANEAKTKILGVSEKTLEQFGAVSEECALEMVNGLFDKTECDIALATTGIAGPDGGSIEKPVGTLYVAIKNKCSTKVKKFILSSKIKRKTMKFLFSQCALEFLIEFLNAPDRTCR